ncbi:hypothetical protein [Psychrobacter sp. I-STPA10]|uniref:hypothetical protein n=1 Tax=Psychrobacter sp. I-STPA10 TaxID=2585769 RepID=UPI001E581D98|nr:hypothetical protein [Psychrobacter sp. I-STPA10]
MINQKKQPNQFAPLMERQSVASITLPKNLNNKYNELLTHTQEIRRLLQDGLPAEIIKTMWIVKYEQESLTIAVSSHTAANHLRYMSSTLVEFIKMQSMTFKQLNSIDIIVSYTTKPLSTSASMTSLPTKNSRNIHDNHNKQVLSTNARKTIAHTATHVITDEKLKQALLKLANCD